MRIVWGATGTATVALVVAWFLPWMGGAAPFALIGHGLSMTGFVFETAPGPGTGLELALFGLVALGAAAFAYMSVPRATAAIAIVAGALGIHLALRDHPGLSSGPGPVVATTALLVLAAAQLTAAFSTRKGSAVVGVAIAAVLAVAAGFGGAAFAAARDIDVTSATAGAPSKVAGHVGQLSGITVTDAASGAERWHHWERGWSTPYVGLSPDGATAYLVVDRVGEQDAMAFAAATGRLLWQKELQTHPWPRFGGDMSPEYPAGRLAIGPGLAVFVGYNEIRYLDPDGRDGTVRMDVQCGNLLAAGGVRQQLYLVGDCGTGIQVLAADRNARTLWSTKVSMPVTGQFGATVDDRGDRIVVTVGGTATTLDAATGKVE